MIFALMCIKVKSYVTFLKIKFKSQILSLYFEIMMIFLKQYKQIQVFNSYMTIKSLTEYFKPKF